MFGDRPPDSRRARWPSGSACRCEVVTRSWHTAGMPADRRLTTGSSPTATRPSSAPRRQPPSCSVRRPSSSSPGWPVLSLARIADAAFALARTQLHGPRARRPRPAGGAGPGRHRGQPGLRGGDPSCLAPLFRHQALIELRRAEVARAGFGLRACTTAMQLAIGFVDLVGSTAAVRAHRPHRAGPGGRPLRGGRRRPGHPPVGPGHQADRRRGDAGRQRCRPTPAAWCSTCGASVRADPLLTDTAARSPSVRWSPRTGDVYGPTVNVAARATAVAEPGQVVVTAATVEACAGRRRPGVHRPLGHTSCGASTSRPSSLRWTGRNPGAAG